MSDFTIFQGANYNRDFFPKKINQSLRFEDGDSAYLVRTPGGAGDLKTWTLSMWVKRGNLGIEAPLWYASVTASSPYDEVRFETDDTMNIYSYNGSYQWRLATKQVFRDTSAWYHIVVQLDTPNQTAKVYINGTQIPSGDLSTNTQPSLNYEGGTNSTNGHGIGMRSDGTGSKFDGYMAEIHFVDGAAYGPEYFGAEVNGVWTPITPPLATVDYGTNGFYLDFADSADIGNNKNSTDGTNDWTPNNLAASDVLSDSPTNSFNVMNPALHVATNNCTYSEGNLKVLRPISNWETVHSTMAVSSGKWYWEVYIGSTNSMVGVCDPHSEVGGLISVYLRAGLWNLHLYNGDMYLNGGGATTTYQGVATGTTGDIIRVALDADNGRVYFGKNDSWFNSGDPAAGTGYLMSSISTNSGYFAPTLTVQAANDFQIINFGQDDTFAGTTSAGGNTDDNGLGSFKYTVPSGYKALCTANLPEPSPAFSFRSGGKPSDHFGTVIYDGNGTTIDVDFGFNPDLVWYKCRTGGISRFHYMFDTVRGANKAIYPDKIDYEDENFPTYHTQSFINNGSRIVRSLGDHLNDASSTYVCWGWKAGGTYTVDTSGTIGSANTSVNVDAGFSITTYTGNSTNGATVPHGLGKAPEVVWVKRRDVDNYSWYCYFKYGIHGNNGSHYINAANAGDGSLTTIWNDTDPDADFVTLGTINGTNQTGGDYVMYAWAPIPGYSSFGKYTGNGQAQGPYVNCGFRPAWLLIKNVTAANTNKWVIYDNKRDSYNFVDERIFIDDGTESGGGASFSFDFLSNGFKVRSTGSEHNSDGSTYIYMAFAEDPVNFSNAR